MISGWFMKGRKAFLYNGAILTLVGFAMRAVTLFLGAYIASTIGAEGVGLQGLIAVIYSFAVTFATSGVGLSVTRLVAVSLGEGEGGERILRGAFIYALVFGTAATALLFSLCSFIGASVLSDVRTVSALRILSLSLLPIALSSVISGYFVAVRRVTLNAVVQVAGQILRIALTVILLLYMSDGSTEGAVRALATGTVITEAVCFFIALIEYILDRRIYGDMRKRGYAVSEVAAMALPLAFSAYVRSFLMSLEHSLIPKRLIDRGNTREESLRSYGFLGGMALPIILFPMTPLSSFSGLLVPEFAESDGRGDHTRMENIASRAASITVFYATVVAVFLFAFSEEIGYVVYDTYEAGKYVQMLAPVIPIMYLDHVTDSMLKGIGEQVFSMWVNIFDSMLSVILVYLLIPIFDISGYAIVIILMELFNFSLSFMRLKKRVRIRSGALSAFASAFALSVIAVTVSRRLFYSRGSSVTPFILVCEMIFAVCIIFAALGAVEIKKAFSENEK